MISLKTKIETAVRMGANCGSLDLTSDDTKTSIDLDDADIQALHDGLCDTEKLAWVRSDNKNLQSLNASLCAESRQTTMMLRVANGSVADLQKEADVLRSELANARANYEYSSADRDKERKRADQAEAKLRKQESLEDDLQIAERLSNGLNGELQATREKLIHAEILAKRWFDRFQVVDAKLASYTDDRSALATAVEGYEFQVEKLTEERNHLCDENHAFRVRLAEVDADRESWRLLAGERMDDRDALRAQVAEMGSGVPVAWGIEAMGEIWRISTNKGAVEFEAKPGSLPVVPLFRAANHAQAAELAAKAEALGAELAREKRMREETRLDLVKMISDRDDWKKEANSYDDRMFKVEQERDKWREQATTSTDKALSLQARVDTLTAGERLTKDALAAAEKRATDAEAARERTFETMDRIVKERNEAWARVKVLEGSGETVAWDVVGDDGMAIACDDESHADKILDEHGGRKRALFEAPQPAAVDVSHIRTLIEHGKQGCYDLSSFVIVLGNMLDKLPTVDVQTIRETCVTGKTAVEKWGKGAVDFVQFLDVILAAIGEKGG